ncbi:MAG: hypothetical protein JJ902_23630 [Roseibium sp.]|nr:hypothetical protein [Roseibium sp.]
MLDDTRGLGLALLAFAEEVARLSPKLFDEAVKVAYAKLDAEAAAEGPARDLRLGFEFLDLAEGNAHRHTIPPKDLSALQ